MPPRIPTEADFAPLSTTLPLALHLPSPPESTTAFLILLHGLGDSEAPFASFARAMALPGVLAISVRGVAPLPSALLLPPEGGGGGAGAHFHWGDDLSLDPRTGDIDADPGFRRASRAIIHQLIRGVLVEKCGWEVDDVILFGFRQGGSLALGLASELRNETLKGVVSIGGPLPVSMIPTTSARAKSHTEVLLCQLDEDMVDAVESEFEHVTVARWKRQDVTMPRNRDEMLPIMKFLADRLKTV
ncbi:hypothetical protein L249_4833 [Ophiocordyceps polyrhachis-furcata BCC 54312]|uniref:Phospholipase/carboxylesterase/thioesterase domain-containing protein n=1 Tax=Ophiocordyceps polyrhachis-furcata BCC 54312 TaxID=1330021 RepID=A0A367L3B7_9HYPO|nr:hypothetical protein L249_4833 [Ophiocordyceps polyrhachis-furcata BCC 54312]